MGIMFLLDSRYFGGGAQLKEMCLLYVILVTPQHKAHGYYNDCPN